MKNKITIEITADGWKTDVTVDGKTYTEHHEMSDDPIVYALDGFFCFDCVQALRECE